jgi:hypothetical protein
LPWSGNYEKFVVLIWKLVDITVKVALEFVLGPDEDVVAGKLIWKSLISEFVMAESLLVKIELTESNYTFRRLSSLHRRRKI